MTLKIKKDTKKWIDYEKDPEIKFLIKPFSVLYLSKVPSEDNYTPETLWETFNQTVCDWSGIIDEDGKPVKCTEISKRAVAEQDYELLMWVVLESTKLSKEKDNEIKN